jgi:hypothetical protein
MEVSTRSLKMYYISIDAQENELSDGVKIANNSCEKIISSGKRWELSHQPIKWHNNKVIS